MFYVTINTIDRIGLCCCISDMRDTLLISSDTESEMYREMYRAVDAHASKDGYIWSKDERGRAARERFCRDQAERARTIVTV